MIHDVYWAVPLRVIMQNGLPRTFEGIYETLDFLEEEWPFKGGEAHWRAIRECRSALDRQALAVTAREAFLAACVEAGLPAVRAERTHVRFARRRRPVFAKATPGRPHTGK